MKNPEIDSVFMKLWYMTLSGKSDDQDKKTLNLKIKFKLNLK